MPDEPEDLARQFVNDNVFGDNDNYIIKCLFCESEDDLVQVEVQSSDGKQNGHSLCDVCVQPISFPFYTCGKCGFILHKKCSHLSKEIQNHQFHSDHTFSLSCLKKYVKMFSCPWGHRVIVDGIRFSCNISSFRLGVRCASSSFPNSIKQESHDHPLVQIQATSSFKCAGCGDEFKSCLKYGCDTCGFHLDSYCSMLPKTIHHDWDRHPVSLTYPPFYDHPDDLFYELCEEQMHPNLWLYHCRICDQSFHPKCLRPFDKWSNIKLGDAYTFEDHSHKLILVQKGKNNLRSPCDHCCTIYLEDPPSPILECTTCNFQVCMLCAHNGDFRSTRMKVASPYDDSLFTFITSGIHSAISSLVSW